MEQMLLFQVPEADAVRLKRLAGAVHIRTGIIEKEEFWQTIGYLAGKTPHKTAECYQGEVPEQSLMVFCDVTEKHLDRILANIRREGIFVDYKAVLTPFNQNWNVLRMYAEMEKERASLGISQQISQWGSEYAAIAENDGEELVGNSKNESKMLAGYHAISYNEKL